MDFVKRWLDPLFEPLVDDAYWAERREYLVPGSPTPPQVVSSTPSSPGRAAEVLSQVGVDPHATSQTTPPGNSPAQASSVASSQQTETDPLPRGRKRRGASLRDGRSGDEGKTSS